MRISAAEQKNELRQLIKLRKRECSLLAKIEESKLVFEQIERLDAFKVSKCILAYWSLPDEVSTHDFVQKWYKEKTILLPLVKGNELELRVFTGMECMVKGPSFGILEPQKGPLFGEQSIDLAIIPGVAFDTKGNRLGRGKGYYDKLLSHKEMLRVGVCFSFQLVDLVPIDSFDIPMNMVIYSSNQ